jgi:predicted phosphodiesterase
VGTTFEDLDGDGTYELLVRLERVTVPPISNRAYELQLVDTDGTQFQLIVWESAAAAEAYDWQPGEWYRLGGVTANEWATETVPHGTATLTIEPATDPGCPSPTSVLYVTDSHLGKTTHGWKGHVWSVAPTDGFAAAIETAIEHSVAAVVHGGDLFHNPREGIGADDIATVRAGLEELDQKGIPFYFIYGNHERQSGREVMERFCSDGLAVHLGSQFETLDHSVAVSGIDHRRDFAASEFDFETPPRDHQSIVFLHQSMAPFSGGQDPDTSLETVAAELGMSVDLVVTGHTHTRSDQTVREQRGLAGGATARLGDTKSALAPSAELLTVRDGALTVTRVML